MTLLKDSKAARDPWIGYVHSYQSQIDEIAHAITNLPDGAVGHQGRIVVQARFNEEYQRVELVAGDKLLAFIDVVMIGGGSLEARINTFNLSEKEKLVFEEKFTIPVRFL